MEQAELRQWGMLPYEQIPEALDRGDLAAALSIAPRLAGEFTEMIKGMRFLVEECLAYSEPVFRDTQATLAERIVAAIQSRNSSEALALIDEKRERHYRPIHDAMVECIAGCFNWVVKSFGPRQLEDCYRQLAEAQRQGFQRWQTKGTLADFARSVAASFSAHLGKTTVTEDDEKFTVWLDPCGTGGRMGREGCFEPNGPNLRIAEAQPMTFGLANFPAYCGHCAMWQGVTSIEWFGRVLRVAEPWRTPDEPCRWHIYKDANAIPAEYYQRLGAQKPAAVPQREVGSFASGEITTLGLTASEKVRAALDAGDFDRAVAQASELSREYVTMFRGLALLIRLLPDYCEPLFLSQQDSIGGQVAAAIKSGDAAEAKRLIETKKRVYLEIHDVYWRFVAGSFTWIHRNFGDEAMYKCHRHFAERQKRYFERIEQAPLERHARGFARSMAQHCGKVHVEEDAEKYTFTFDPCGTGGRMRQAGLFDPVNGRFSSVHEPQPMTFGEADYPSYCGHCAVWSSIAPIEWWGHPQLVVKPMRRSEDFCVAYIYKDPAAIPEEFYRLLGKEKPGVHA